MPRRRIKNEKSGNSRSEGPLDLPGLKILFRPLHPREWIAVASLPGMIAVGGCSLSGKRIALGIVNGETKSPFEWSHAVNRQS